MSAHQLHRSLARLNLRCFNVRPQRVQILRTPTAFYESLIERCDRAKARVTLSALYWGTGPLALNGAAEAASRARGEPRRRRQRDLGRGAGRGRRDKDGGRPSDALAAVADAGGDIHLVDASGRSGLIGEILGVYHAKACVFDDATLLTGANLSEEYFRSRQDRYVVVRDSKVADWYDQAVRAAAAAPDAGERARAPASSARTRAGAAAAAPPLPPVAAAARGDAFPTAQVRDILDLDARALSAALDASPRCGLSTAYANPPPAVVEALGRTAATVVVPSPDTPGFAGATGVAPCRIAHAQLARDLATKLKGSGDVRAWAAPRETYHAKGCWAFSRATSGSGRDARSPGPRTELAVASARRRARRALVVRDGALRRRLGDEWRRLRNGCRARSRCRRAGLHGAVASQGGAKRPLHVIQSTARLAASVRAHQLVFLCVRRSLYRFMLWVGTGAS